MARQAKQTDKSNTSSPKKRAKAPAAKASEAPVDMTEYYLWLLQVMKYGNPRTGKLLQYFGDAKKVYDAVMGGKRSFLKPDELSALATATLDKSRVIMQLCRDKSISIVTLGDEDYPELLRNICNPPILLFVRGSLKGLDDEVTVTAIGTREPSDYSAKLGYKICGDLAKLGVVIVSGMAYGLDGICMRGALENGGRTIGVLACGIEVDYPKGSGEFRERIIANGGAVISEMLPYDKPTRGCFQIRNRIMSGLSLGTMIVQAGISSGCLITANHAISQNRDVFCVPPANVFLPEYAGVVGYLRDGAIPVFNHLDVVNAYYRHFSDKLEKLNELSRKSGYKINEDSGFIFERDDNNGYTGKPRPSHNRRDTSDSVPETPAAPQKKLPQLGEREMLIYGVLQGGAANVDILLEKTELDDDELSELLLALELDEIIQMLPGGKYGLV